MNRPEISVSHPCRRRKCRFDGQDLRTYIRTYKMYVQLCGTSHHQMSAQPLFGPGVWSGPGEPPAVGLLRPGLTCTCGTGTRSPHSSRRRPGGPAPRRCSADTAASQTRPATDTHPPVTPTPGYRHHRKVAHGRLSNTHTHTVLFVSSAHSVTYYVTGCRLCLYSLQIMRITQLTVNQNEFAEVKHSMQNSTASIHPSDDTAKRGAFVGHVAVNPRPAGGGGQILPPLSNIRDNLKTT